jgi:hypothetical protein
MAGEITTPEIAHQLAGEGIGTIVVLSDDIEKYRPGTFPATPEITQAFVSYCFFAQSDAPLICHEASALAQRIPATGPRYVSSRNTFPSPSLTALQHAGRII